MIFATVWRTFEKLSLIAWGVMLTLYVVGATVVPVVPATVLEPQAHGRCYNFESKIGTPYFRCSETGFDGPAEALLTGGWLWVSPVFLAFASELEPSYGAMAIAWVLATFGVLSFAIRLVFASTPQA